MNASPAPTVSETATGVPATSTRSRAVRPSEPSWPRVTTTRPGPRASHAAATASGSAAGVEPGEVGPADLDDVRQGDPALEAGDVRRAFADEARADVRVQADDTAPVLAAHDGLERRGAGLADHRDRAEVERRHLVRELGRQVLQARAGDRRCPRRGRCRPARRRRRGARSPGSRARRPPARSRQSTPSASRRRRSSRPNGSVETRPRNPTGMPSRPRPIATLNDEPPARAT